MSRDMNENDIKMPTNEDFDNMLDFDDDDPLSATSVSKKSLVIFFLIDTSGSMKGTKMGELNTVMEELIPEIRRVGEADTDVKVAVLTFSNSVMWMYELCRLLQITLALCDLNLIVDLVDFLAKL